MKPVSLWFLIGGACFAWGLLSTLVAQQPASTVQVLDLDEKDSYVELPPNIFNDLTEATIEGWMKWDRLGHWLRFFDCGKAH